MLKVTTFSKDTFPALYAATSILYILIGEEPVGRPRTNGCSLVGPKAVILSGDMLEVGCKVWRGTYQ